MRSVSNHFDDGNREYLSSSDAETASECCKYYGYSNEFDDVCISLFEEPDPDELTAFWHEEEVSK